MGEGIATGVSAAHTAIGGVVGGMRIAHLVSAPTPEFSCAAHDAIKLN